MEKPNWRWRQPRCQAPPSLGFKLGFFVKQKLEVLVGSAGWDGKAGPTPRPEDGPPTVNMKGGGDTENPKGARHRDQKAGRVGEDRRM